MEDIDSQLAKLEWIPTPGRRTIVKEILGHLQALGELNSLEIKETIRFNLKGPFNKIVTVTLGPRWIYAVQCHITTLDERRWTVIYTSPPIPVQPTTVSEWIDRIKQLADHVLQAPDPFKASDDVRNVLKILETDYQYEQLCSYAPLPDVPAAVGGEAWKAFELWPIGVELHNKRLPFAFSAFLPYTTTDAPVNRVILQNDANGKLGRVNIIPGSSSAGIAEAIDQLINMNWKKADKFVEAFIATAKQNGYTFEAEYSIEPAVCQVTSAQQAVICTMKDALQDVYVTFIGMSETQKPNLDSPSFNYNFFHVSVLQPLEAKRIPLQQRTQELRTSYLHFSELASDDASGQLLATNLFAPGSIVLSSLEKSAARQSQRMTTSKRIIDTLKQTWQQTFQTEPTSLDTVALGTGELWPVRLQVVADGTELQYRIPVDSPALTIQVMHNKKASVPLTIDSNNAFVGEDDIRIIAGKIIAHAQNAIPSLKPHLATEPPVISPARGFPGLQTEPRVKPTGLPAEQKVTALPAEQKVLVKFKYIKELTKPAPEVTVTGEPERKQKSSVLDKLFEQEMNVLTTVLTDGKQSKLLPDGLTFQTQHVGGAKTCTIQRPQGTTAIILTIQEPSLVKPDVHARFDYVCDKHALNLRFAKRIYRAIYPTPTSRKLEIPAKWKDSKATDEIYVPPSWPKSGTPAFTIKPFRVALARDATMDPVGGLWFQIYRQTINLKLKHDLLLKPLNNLLGKWGVSHVPKDGHSERIPVITELLQVVFGVEKIIHRKCTRDTPYGVQEHHVFEFPWSSNLIPLQLEMPDPTFTELSFGIFLLLCVLKSTKIQQERQSRQRGARWSQPKLTIYQL